LAKVILVKFAAWPWLCAVLCKTAKQAKTIRRMTHRKALEQWEMKVGNCEATPQALWPIVKSLMEKDGPKAPTTVHGPLGATYHLNEKANMIADCLENYFTSHVLYDECHEQQVETRVQVVLASVDDTSLEKVRPCDIHK
jgi:hypothetical protein